MWRYAQQNTSNLWGGIRGDMIATLLALLAGYVAFAFDPLKLRPNPHFGETGAVLIYFIGAIVLGYIFTFLGFGGYSAVFGKKVNLDLEFITKPPDPGNFRYLVLCINNKSVADLELCSVKLKKVSVKEGKWKPDERIGYEPLLWGSIMGERSGTKTIKKNNGEFSVVDILHTSNKNRGGRIYFTI